MPSAKKLNSDELGVKGESIFTQLCVDAKLVCNKSERDRTGWDFIVEFPFVPLTNKTSLDRRLGPISCVFQQKTIWYPNKRVKLLLSSVERLAKDLKPSFIYVIRINEDPQRC